MSRKSMKSALGSSLSAEADSFKSRFERAEAELATREDTITSLHKNVNGVIASNGHGANPAVETPPVPRVIREAFTIPEGEHGCIEEIRARMLKQALAVSKSETLRAGLMLLGELSDEQLQELFSRLEKVKTGRPKENS